MANHRRKKATKAAVIGTAIAATVGVGLTPVVADAATYVVGLPDWIPSDTFGNVIKTLPSNPGAVTGAILDDRENTAGIKGWGLGTTFTEEQLAPVWVTWYNPTGSATNVKTAEGGGFFDHWYTGTVTGKDWTQGQWVSPSDLTGIDPAALLKYGLDGGDLTAALAPLVNWTAYLSNTNFVGYGDGAIAVGAGYQDFIDLARSPSGLEAGPALTGPRKIAITDPNDPLTKDVTRAYTKVNGLEYLAIKNAPGVWLLTKVGTSGPGSSEFPDAPEDLPTVEITPGGVIDVTLLTVNLLRNPGRPNGGLYSRFAPIYQALTDVNPVTPERQDVLPEGLEGLSLSDLSFDDLGNLVAVAESLDGKPIVLTVLKTDTTWEYDILSDAPVTGSPVAWANSAAAALLPLTLGASLLDGSGVGAKLYVAPDGTIYTTITQDQLPLLAPARLAAGLLSVATGEDVNTPVADALEPLLKLLVDTSYTDVERNADGTWTRTLDEMHVPTLFGTQTLTREQSALLAGDIIAELGKGVGSEYTDIVQRVTTRVVNFLEDNDIQVSDAVKVAAAKLATEPGAAIRTVSRRIGDDVSKVLTGIEAKLPEGPATPTQEQLATGQRQVGKVLRVVKDDVDETTAQINEAADEFASSKVGVALKSTGDKVEADVTKRVTKTQTSIAHAQERADKVNAKLKQGDLKGAAKQIGENVKNRVDRLKKDVNNGLKKLNAKDTDTDKGTADNDK
ncbi:PE-PPE domain-containing protein [Mycobacterium sp. GA-1841]|uniref:PE-PPE domain-containing protein n=1 Tax=Mycobacterium sp. GA-1841 TaxID=1834154 RepID=UPI00096EBA86|nr:PE-PPE domain-containing protein [Mycobacterium sp. GA-1841]OMC36548.1 PE-PPE domain-containing protein [Mycobacterium sp. GA-1841]